MIVSGPVSSNRLGKCIYINNIPHKACTFSCVYCKYGPTLNRDIVPRPFYLPDQIVSEVEDRMESLHSSEKDLDYIAFVSSGEPTLDVNLGKTIEKLRSFGIRIAVLSNASLIWQPEVREQLAGVDCAFFKLDAVTEKEWMLTNQPHRDIKLDKILAGLKLFAATYDGCILTETVLVSGVNDDVETLTKTAEYLGSLIPDKAFLSTSLFSQDSVQLSTPLEDCFDKSYRIFKQHLPQIQCRFGHRSDFCIDD